MSRLLALTVLGLTMNAKDVTGGQNLNYVSVPLCPCHVIIT